MTTVTGPVLFAKFKGVRAYENKDENGRVLSVSKSFIVHVSYPDGTISAVNIYFPREGEGEFREPTLTLGEEYGFPVMIRPKRNARELSYAARSDLMPFPAPSFDQ